MLTSQQNGCRDLIRNLFIFYNIVDTHRSNYSSETIENGE